MGGGIRLVLMFVPLILILMVATVHAVDDSKPSGAASPQTAALPKTEVHAVQETFHGTTKIVDKYRWLEDSNNPAVEKWVADEMAYTHSVLDPLPGHDAIHQRLTELLSIGSISVPQIGGKYYFYTRRDGMQNQPVLYVREGDSEAKSTAKSEAKGEGKDQRAARAEKRAARKKNAESATESAE